MLFNMTFCSYSDAIGWLQNHLLTCPFKKLTGIDCPGCGLQRSIIALLQGDFIKSIEFYPATLPILLIALLGIFEKYIPVNKRKLITQPLYIFTGVLIAGSYIFKLSGHQL